METLYRKIGTRYEPVGYNGIPDLVDGIWLIQHHKYSKGYRNLIGRLSEVPQIKDIVTKGALVAMTDDLTRYLVKLGKSESEEFKSAQAKLGGAIHGEIHVSNISPSDFIDLILDEIGKDLEKTAATDWHKLMYDFRSTDNSVNTNDLYKFVDWLKDKGYSLKQRKV